MSGGCETRVAVPGEILPEISAFHFYRLVIRPEIMTLSPYEPQKLFPTMPLLGIRVCLKMEICIQVIVCSYTCGFGFVNNSREICM